jgi:hypothetical protein
MLVIIYKTENGISIIKTIGHLPIEEVARKDVPAGVDYWILNISDIPSDRTFRDAWEADVDALGEPHGKGIGAEAWFAEQKEKEALNDNNQSE